MKTIVAIGLMSLLIVVVLFQWTAVRSSAVVAPASVSQIYIHGTPVCVFRNGDSIVAAVGECESGAAPGDGAPGGTAPDEGSTGMVLPPGHPPVGPDMLPDGSGKRILI